MKRLAVALCLAVVLVPFLGCDKVGPVAPAGTTITLSANPSQITSATGTSTITAIVRRSNGLPVNPGTEVRFTTNIGTIDPLADTDRDGVARATLQGDGRFGLATVAASVGGSTTPSGGGSGSSGSGSGSGSTAPPPATGGTSSATVSVQIGVAARTLSLQANPPSIPSTGGQIQLLALVRDSTGQPRGGIGVNFRTELGRLSSGGRIVTTNDNGEARDTLTVGEGDLTTNTTSFNVTAETPGADGALISVTSQVHVQTQRPVAAFDVRRGSTANEVDFINQSTGQGTLTYRWEFGDGAVSSEQNPIHLYATAGQYSVRLTVTNQNNEASVVVRQITVPVPTS
jgi:PKD domain-containing protein/invasin-like protein